MGKDIALTSGNEYFRYRACGIIIENDTVLMVSNDRDDYFYSIGGAVKIGETAEEACVREVFEETGVYFEIDRLMFIHENFVTFSETEQRTEKNAHELAFYFLMKPQEHGDFKPDITNDGFPEHLTWISISTYRGHKAYPLFFADELPKLRLDLRLQSLSESGQASGKSAKLSVLTEVKRIVTHE
ncbi:NUDIX domain-containing protein [Lactococcus allomyrinae]|uniref:NUDIX domain-containing protein n=2 Tax=Lactococcus allomyrinae TaxID=2419773 RepID=A0A387BKQ0_9LACT|nr:NUDIX domain-containing protein [Lactococcus allomyrinae]